MQFIRKDTVSSSFFVAAGRVAREYIAACALVGALTQAVPINTKLVDLFGRSWSNAFKACRNVGAVEGLIAAAENHYPRDVIRTQLLTGMGKWCNNQMGATFLDRCVAIPSERRLPKWASIVREADKIDDDAALADLFNVKSVDLNKVKKEVNALLGLTLSPLASLMVELRIPMGASDGRTVASSLEFRVAHLWLLSDFFHNLMPMSNDAALLPREITSWNTASDLDQQSAILREGGDAFANGFTETYVSSPEWLEVLNPLLYDEDRNLSMSLFTRILTQLSDALLSSEIKDAIVPLDDDLDGGDAYWMGRPVLAEVIKMRQLKSLLFGLPWIRVYNVILSLLFHVRAMHHIEEEKLVARGGRITKGDDEEEPDRNGALTVGDLDLWMSIARRFHSTLNIAGEDAMIAVGSYGNSESIYDVHARIQ
jgi:hypothetical protein